MAQQTVDDYLDRLNRALSGMPSEQRRELLEEIRNHVEDALAAIPEPSEADVRNVLEQLGAPGEIAEEARRRSGLTASPNPTWRDWTAVLLLATGAVIMQVSVPLGSLAWIVAVLLIVTSRVWTTRDKAIGVLAVPLGEIFVFLWLRIEPDAFIPIVLAVIGVPLICAVYLGYRLRL